MASQSTNNPHSLYDFTVKVGQFQSSLFVCSTFPLYSIFDSIKFEEKLLIFGIENDSEIHLKKLFANTSKNYQRRFHWLASTVFPDLNSIHILSQLRQSEITYSTQIFLLFFYFFFFLRSTAQQPTSCVFIYDPKYVL